MRLIGTTSRGIRCPIIREGDDLRKIVVDSVLDASKEGNFELHDRDVIAITESVVARAQGNYCTVDDIAEDLMKMYHGEDTIGVVFPILSRNRFSLILKGIAKAFKKVIILLSYPTDEVGNALVDKFVFGRSNVNHWTDCLTEEQFRNKFGYFHHPFTGIDYIGYYKHLVKEQGAEVEFLFSNNPTDIFSKTSNVLGCDIHTSSLTAAKLYAACLNNDDKNYIYYSLADVLANPVRKCGGYNKNYGLLGSNKATEDKLKLFPHEDYELLFNIQKDILEATGAKVEVMVYGDGAFKDPAGGIWEFADPVVSPFFTIGLDGQPNELKLKYLADNEFGSLTGDELKEAISEKIRNKDNNLFGKMDSQGTTPRRLTDLIGSLCDLTSGSGDKGTPIVLVQGYFDSYISE